MTANKKPNVLFLMVDAFRHDVFEDMDVAKQLAPTICSLIDKGFIQKLISNGMVTQVAMPSILTQSYPFDYGGYNYGVRYRPKTFIEKLKDNGYATHFVASHYITGPLRVYERGCDTVRALYDHKSIVEMYIRHVLYHELELFDQGEITEKELCEILLKDFDEILAYAEWPGDRIEKRWFTPRCNKNLTAALSLKYRNERELLRYNPKAVINKLKTISSTMYVHFLGQEKIGRSLLFWRVVYRAQAEANRLLKIITSHPLKLFTVYKPPIAREPIDTALGLINNNHKPWFMFLHMMDVHESTKIGRWFQFLKRLRYFNKAKKIRSKSKTSRTIWYDISLMYLDNEISRLFKKLKERNQYDDTLILVSGDHGIGWDKNRNSEYEKDLGFRAYYEHVNVPYIISPTTRKPNETGMHDGMSMSATLLDELNISPDKSYLGRSCYEAGKDAIIVESTGRGSCDLKRTDLRFTIITKKYKLMILLCKAELIPKRLYDLENDPYEYDNIVSMPSMGDTIRGLTKHLFNERKEVLKKRGVNVL